MITNTQVTRYLREHARGEWQKYLSPVDLADMHGLQGKFRVLAEDYLPISASRKELISNLAGHKVAWLDGYEALTHALVYLSPAVPTCKSVHVNIIPEVTGVLDKLKQRYDAGDFNDWDSELSVHTISHADPEELSRVIPDGLDVAVVVAYEASQVYMETLLKKLVPGGVIWFEASTLGGLPILNSQSELARLNTWISAQPNLEVTMGTDFIGYTLVRKVAV